MFFLTLLLGRFVFDMDVVGTVFAWLVIKLTKTVIFILQLRRQRPKERRKTYLLKFIMSQTEFSSSPLNPTLTSVSRIIIWLFASARNPGVTLGASFNHPIPSIRRQILCSLLPKRSSSMTPAHFPSCPTLGPVHPPLLSKLCKDFLTCPFHPLLPHHPIPPESPPHKSHNGLFHVPFKPWVSPALILPTASFHS